MVNRLYLSIYLMKGEYNGQQAHERMLRTTSHQGDANKNHNKLSPHIELEWLLSNIQKIVHGGENVEKRRL